MRFFGSEKERERAGERKEREGGGGEEGERRSDDKKKKKKNSSLSPVSTATAVLACQFQIRSVWSSDADRIHGQEEWNCTVLM